MGLRRDRVYDGGPGPRGVRMGDAAVGVHADRCGASGVVLGVGAGVRVPLGERVLGAARQYLYNAKHWPCAYDR